MQSRLISAAFMATVAIAQADDTQLPSNPPSSNQALPPSPSLGFEHLKGLEWWIGSWIDKGDDNTYTFSSEGRDIDGQMLPNVGPFKIIRGH